MSSIKGVIVYFTGIIVLLGVLIGVAVFVDSRLEPPKPIIKIVEIERIVTPEPVPILCLYTERPPNMAVLMISYVDLGQPLPGWRSGYLCNDTMSFRSDIPRGGAILNVEAHLGATRGDNGN